MEWLYVLEEFHKKRLGPEAYYEMRAASVEGETTAGLMYARGLSTHSLATVAQLVTLRPGRTTYGGSRVRVVAAAA